MRMLYAAAVVVVFGAMFAGAAQAQDLAYERDRQQVARFHFCYDSMIQNKAALIAEFPGYLDKSEIENTAIAMITKAHAPPAEEIAESSAQSIEPICDEAEAAAKALDELRAKRDMLAYDNVVCSRVRFEFCTITGGDFAWPITRIVDGGTVRVDAGADIPAALASLAVRLRGVDTPEKGGRARCDSEWEAGQLATEFTSEAVAGASTIVIRDPEWGAWGGRVIADVLIDGRSLSAALIEAGLGRAYDGRLRPDWCGG